MPKLLFATVVASFLVLSAAVFAGRPFTMPCRPHVPISIRESDAALDCVEIPEISMMTSPCL